MTFLSDISQGFKHTIFDRGILVSTHDIVATEFFRIEFN